MSALIKSVKIFSRISQNPAAISTILRNASHWNKDWQPGPYPKTEEERRAAAKKYGLLPEDYKPYPDDGTYNTGDYPHLEDKPVEWKDIYYPYDHPEMRRNFGETLHAEHDYHDEQHVGTPGPLRYSLTNMFAFFFATVGGIYLLYDFFDDKKIFPYAMPKQLPADGKKHYSFEPLR